MTGAPLAAPTQLLRRSVSPLTWVTMIILGLGALVLVVVLVVLGGPVGAIVIMLLAAVSFPVLILVCFWLDRYEPEPGRYRLAALGWGGVVAVAISLLAEQLLFSADQVTFVNLAVVAPVVEESAKGLFLVAVVILRRTQIHGLLDGIIYAALVGIGFAFVEDVLYYLSALGSGGPEALSVTFFLRGVMSPFAHPLFTAAFGIGIGLAVTARQPAVRVFAPIIGFVAAVTLHAVWNGSGLTGTGDYFTVYVALMLPLLVLVLVVATWARSREGKMIGTALTQVVPLGWIRADEIRWVAKMADRVSSRGYAKIHGGKPAARLLRAYQQTMTEVAFLHTRAVNGTGPPDLPQRMGVLLQQAEALRPYVILPPPLERRSRSWPTSG